VGPFFRLSAWVVILIFFLLYLINGISTLGQDGGGVAFFAHLGGFLAGLLLVRLLLPPSQRKPPDEQGWTRPSAGGQPPRHRNHPSRLPQWPRR
jgi:membrane associated rhomboid family serine protease